MIVDDDAVVLTRIDQPSTLVTRVGQAFEIIPASKLGGYCEPADHEERLHDRAMCVVAMGVSALSAAAITAAIALLVWNLYLRG